MSSSNRFLLYAVVIMMTFVCSHGYANKNPVQVELELPEDPYQATEVELVEEDIFKSAPFSFVRKVDLTEAGNSRVVYEVVLDGSASNITEDLENLCSELKKIYTRNVITILVEDSNNKERIWVICEDGEVDFL